MSTAYYARKIPTIDRINELKEKLTSDNWNAIREEIGKTFDRFTPYTIDEPFTGYIELCHVSFGWKTLWNPNIYRIKNGHTEEIKEGDGITRYHYVKEPDTARYLYPLTKKGIKAFIDQEDIEIYNEYGEKQDKETFWKKMLDRDKIKRANGKSPLDSSKYRAENPEEQHYSYRNEYTIFLENLGYKINPSLCSDFYSDNLRFSTWIQ